VSDKAVVEMHNLYPTPRPTPSPFFPTADPLPRNK